MKTSREQFEEWYSNRYGIPDFSKAFENAKMADAFEVWQASRATIEIEIPGTHEADTKSEMRDVCIQSLEDYGLKIKGA